jgi:hypothetical protein
MSAAPQTFQHTAFRLLRTSLNNFSPSEVYMAKRSIPSATPADYLKQAFDWYEYSWRWWEMMTAASLTIGMRTSGMSYKARKNQLPDFAESWRMVAEKNQALLQSATAAAPWQRAWQQYWLQTATDKAPAKGGDVAAHWMDQQFQFGKLMLQSLTATLQPFHKASTANAFRLSGTGKPRARAR